MKESVGLRIRSIRTLKGISQNGLAKLAGISQSGLSSIENGTASPSTSTLELLAKALHINVSELLGDAKEVPDTNDSLWELRESLRRDPKRKMLFDAAANVSEKDIQTAVRLLDALKGTSEDGAD